VLPCPACLQVLASPTTRDFTNVMLFLYRQFDPVLPKTFKLEEEVGAGGVAGGGWCLPLSSLSGCQLAVAQCCWVQTGGAVGWSVPDGLI
jgi:hypothetical protein